MALPPYPFLIGLGVFLVLAAIVCYLVANPPAITDWHGILRFATAVLLSAAILAFGYAKRSYDLTQPLSVAEGYLVDYTIDSHGGSGTIKFQTLAGENLDLYAYGQIINPSKSTLRRVTFVPIQNDIVLVEYQSGSHFISEFENRNWQASLSTQNALHFITDFKDHRWQANIWTISALIVFLLGAGTSRKKATLPAMPMHISESGR